MRLFLFIAPTQHESLYEKAAAEYNARAPAERDSGFDLYCDGGDVDTVYSKYAALVGQGCRALAVDESGGSRAFWLAPRSSISKTSWRLANSLGLIDATYRGVIKAALNSTVGEALNPMSLHGMRLVQIVRADLCPWDSVMVVKELPGPGTLRLEGGFGSTGSS